MPKMFTLYSPLNDAERADWAKTVQDAGLALAGSQVAKAPREDIILALNMMGVREMLALADPVTPRYDPPVEPVTV